MKVSTLWWPSLALVLVVCPPPGQGGTRAALGGETPGATTGMNIVERSPVDGRSKRQVGGGYVLDRTDIFSSG